MVIFCHKCGTKNIDRETCSNCHTQLITNTETKPAPVFNQEKVQLKCPWCGTVNNVIDETNCKNCGGPLPAISKNNEGLDMGISPGNPPRIIPKVYIKKLKYRNVHFIIGIVFTVPFIWTIIFPIIGIFLMRYGLKNANNKLAALENGIKAEGVLTDIYKDASQTVNGRHPWKLEYEFTTQSGKIVSATKTGAWNSNNRYRKANDRLRIVYLSENPEISAIWPPVD